MQIKNLYKNGSVKLAGWGDKTLTTGFYRQKNVGFSSSARATEPQVPEGMVMLALNLFKASAAPDEGREENKNGGIKNMKKSKGMQLGAMLATLLLVSIAFAAAVSAQGANDQTKVEKPGKIITPDGRYIMNESDFDKAVISSGTITVPTTNDINERHNISRNTIMALRKEFNVPDNETVTLGCVKGNCTYQIVKPVKGTVITSSVLTSPPPSFDGWAEDAYYNAPSGTTSFHGNWQVPAAPSSNVGQLIYYFIALEPGGSADIIQPVLEWNYGGSNQWQIASWYCITGRGCVHGNTLSANVNDYLSGYLEYQGNPAQWWIYTDDRTQQSEAVNNIADGRAWNRNYVTLEPYGVNSCSTYPGGADFTGLGINNGIPGWSPEINQTAKNACPSLGVTIVSPYEVKLNTGN